MFKHYLLVARLAIFHRHMSMNCRYLGAVTIMYVVEPWCVRCRPTPLPRRPGSNTLRLWIMDHANKYLPALCTVLLVERVFWRRIKSEDIWINQHQSGIIKNSLLLILGTVNIPRSLSTNYPQNVWRCVRVGMSVVDN